MNRKRIARLLRAWGFAAFAFFFSGAQRHLSTPARSLRRKASRVEGKITMLDGSISPIDVSTLLAPLEAALRALTWATIALAPGGLRSPGSLAGPDVRAIDVAIVGAGRAGNIAALMLALP